MWCELLGQLSAQVGVVEQQHQRLARVQKVP